MTINCNNHGIVTNNGTKEIFCTAARDGRATHTRTLGTEPGAPPTWSEGSI